MEMIITTVTASLLGLFSAVVVGYFAGKRQVKLEYRKETRLAVAELTKHIAAAALSMSWLTWKAKFQSQHFTLEDVEQYDAKIHQVYLELTGAYAVVAALNRAAYQKISKIVDEVYELDGNIATATTAFRDKLEDATEKIAAYSKDAGALETSINGRVAEIMSQV